MTQEAMKQALGALEDFVDVIKYDNEQDDIGRRACCDVLSYNPHSESCKAKQAITAIKEAIREHAMYEVQRLGQEIEQEPVAYKWSDAGDLKLLKKGDVLRVLRKGQEYYRAFKFCGAIEECDYAYDGNAPFAWLLVGMAYTDKIVYTRKNFSTGAVYADRGDVVEIRQPINYPTHPQRTEQNFCSRCGKRTNDIHTCTPPRVNT
jgi:hypothetical protein